MPSRRLRTANYSDEARLRLGNAVAKAREAAGYKHVTKFARAAGIDSVASVRMVEAGKPGVAQTILFAIGRFLPGWTEDTPREILEGGPIPAAPGSSTSELDTTRGRPTNYMESPIRFSIFTEEGMVRLARVLDDEDLAEVKAALKALRKLNTRVLELEALLAERELSQQGTNR